MLFQAKELNMLTELKIKFSFLIFIILSFFIANTGFTQSKLEKGSGKFIFQNPKLINGKTMNVYYYMPRNYNENSRVLFVLHGTGRNADSYRDSWIEHVEKNNVLLIVPGFSKELFPLDQDYNMGNMFIMDSSDAILSSKPKQEWSFSVMEPIFDSVKLKTNNNSEGYYIYGHSAGSQFVHRYLYFTPGARIVKAVFANAGWYTMPDFNQLYPYGLKATKATLENLKEMFNKKIVVLLGNADIDPNHSQLRRTKGAMLQGPFRLARGKFYFISAAKLAAENNFNFKWELRFVEGVAHSNSQMAEAAANYLFNN
jgi:predicted esterase